MILDDYNSGWLPKVDRFKKIIIKFVEFLGKYDFWKNPVLTGLLFVKITEKAVISSCRVIFTSKLFIFLLRTLNYIGTTQQLHCPLTQMARLVFSIFGLFKQWTFSYGKENCQSRFIFVNNPSKDCQRLLIFAKSGHTECHWSFARKELFQEFWFPPIHLAWNALNRQ